MDTRILIVGLSLLFHGVVAQQPCKAGWSGPSPSGKCYLILPKTGIVPTADKQCRDVGGELSSIENAQENDYLTANVFPLASDWLLTGGIRQSNSMPWTWADGTLQTFQNFGTPSMETTINGGSGSNYIYIYSHATQRGTANYGRWFADRPFEHQVLCQIKPPPPGSPNSGTCAYNGGCKENCGCGCN